MKHLLVCACMIMCAFAPLGEVSLVDHWPERQPWQDLSTIAALGPRFPARDWTVVIAVLVFVALNMFLWTLPMTQTQLFLISFPAGFVAMIAFVWYVGRDRGAD